MELEADLRSADAADEASDAVAPQDSAGGERRADDEQVAATPSGIAPDIPADAQQVTGATAVAARLREHLDAVDALAGIDLSEHVDFYQRVHGDLQSALKDIDDA